MFWLGAIAGYVVGFGLAGVFFFAAGRWRETEVRLDPRHQDQPDY